VFHTINKKYSQLQPVYTNAQTMQSLTGHKHDKMCRPTFACSSLLPSWYILTDKVTPQCTFLDFLLDLVDFAKSAWWQT